MNPDSLPINQLKDEKSNTNSHPYIMYDYHV